MPSILEITDGTTTINLISKNMGFHLSSWRPAIIGLKEGGIYQDSPVATGRQLVFGADAGVANEVFNLKANDLSQDELARQIQELLRLLNKARDYWLADWQDTPVYIRAQSECETNVRYALIHNYSLSSIDNPYAQPFFNSSDVSAMDNLALGIERGHWLADIPGQISSTQCVTATNVQTWDYASAVVEVDSPNNACHLLQHPNGNVYSMRVVGGVAQVRESTDDGDSWATVYTGVLPITGSAGGSFLDSNNNMFFISPSTVNGDYSLVRSGDGGSNWDEYITNFALSYEMEEADNGDLLMGGRASLATEGKIIVSTDQGVTWAGTFTSSELGIFTAIQKADNGTLIAAYDRTFGTDTSVYLSTDNGNNWTFNQKLSNVTDVARSMNDNGTIYLFGIDVNTSTLVIFKSADNGTTFTLHNLTDIEYARGGIFQGTDSWLMVGGPTDDTFYQSFDKGYTWKQLYDSGNTLNNEDADIIELANGDILMSTLDVFKLETGSIVDLGSDAPCSTGGAFVSNKYAVANITHIKTLAGVSFNDIFPATLPQELMDSGAPAVGDIVYFGINEDVIDSGPFSGLVFDLSVGADAASYTIVWEYWDGAAWSTLTAQDNTNMLSSLGISSIHWNMPGDWATVSINSVTAWWIRARLSALSGTFIVPVQQNRNVYAVNLPYVELSASSVLGDIPALLRIQAVNPADKDGRDGSLPDLWYNRLVVGLRDYNRGNNFRAYINLADTQNPDGVDISVGTNTAFVSDPNAATGRTITYTPLGAEAMATRATIALGTTIARDFYGTFHVFLRCKRSGSSTQTDFDIQLQIVTGSGGITKTTDSQQLESNVAATLLDFGQITLPIDGRLGVDELNDTTTINIQASAAQTGITLTFGDLVLIPVDEWSVDTIDLANTDESIVGLVDNVQRMMDIDSLSKPKYPIRTLVRQNGTELVVSIYDAISPGQAIVQANKQQRLWFFAMRTSATGTSFVWVSLVDIAHEVLIYKTDRYLGLRGDR